MTLPRYGQGATTRIQLADGDENGESEVVDLGLNFRELVSQMPRTLRRGFGEGKVRNLIITLAIALESREKIRARGFQLPRTEKKSGFRCWRSRRLEMGDRGEEIKR